MKKNIKQYDLSLKDIFSGIEKNFVKVFLNLEIKKAETLNIEFPKIEEKVADYICKIEDFENKDYILHIEFQTTNHKSMHIRMARYLIELYRIYNLPIIQVVLYIGKEKLSMRNEIKFKILDTKIEYEYKLIDMRTIDCEKLINSNESDLVVLSILCNFEDRDKSEVVREILKRINELNLNDELQKRNYILKLEVLSKLRKLENIVLKEEKMLDTIKIEDLPSFKYGEEIGEKRGERRGERRGEKKGEKKGIEKEKFHIALKMLKAGVDIKDISLFTELTIQEIEKLKEDK